MRAQRLGRDLLIIVCSICFYSCQNKPGTKLPAIVASKVSGKPIVIRIQPFTGTDENEINELAASIKKTIPHVELNNSISLPAFAYYAPRARYKADSLLKFLSGMAKENEIMLGVTTKDISTTKGNISDWGIMGLGMSPGNACVISSYRPENKSQLFKVAIHELGHTFGLSHCPDNACYMRDAEGGNPTDEEAGFCDRCKKYLQDHGWKL